MNQAVGKYLGKDIPMKERILYLATFMSGVASLLFVSIGVLMHVSPLTACIFFSISLISTAIFFLNRKFHKYEILSHVFLAYCNLIALPLIMILSEKNTLEIPIYFLVGLTFSLVLLEGLSRIVFFSSIVVVDLVCAYYCFIIRVRTESYSGATELLDYFRISLAIVVTGVICGVLISYRNHLLDNELERQQEANANAERVSYAKDMFLVNVSHEVRTPLNAILGTTELLIDSDCGNHIKEMAYNISNSSHALLSITSNLLDFSKMNLEDAMKINNDKYDIAIMLNDIINLISVRLLDSNVEFFVDINPNLPKYLVGDGGKIRQIIINILSNAVKYTPKGYMALKVDFEYEGQENIHLKIEVKDTGIGIKEDAIEKIFVPYNRSGEETDQYIEGNGLGLALCRKLTTAMGGTISAESVYGEGSTFHFEVMQKLEVPYVGGIVGGINDDGASVCYYCTNDSDNNETQKILDSMEISASKAASLEDFTEKCKESDYDYYITDTHGYETIKDYLVESGIEWKKFVVISGCNYSYSGEPFENVLTKPVNCLNFTDLLNHTQNFAVRKQAYEGGFSIPNATVLIVDDNLVNLDVAANLLAKYYPRVITAASGKEGLITLQSEQVDIVYLDYMMPGMDGIDTLKEIRKLENGKYKALPVIALTANVVSGAREMFLREGFDDYLSKPIETDRLAKTLRDHLPSELIRINNN